MERELLIEPSPQAKPAVKPSDFNTAMIHLYRGEVSKANDWRKRLDTTTNWAVITTAAMISFAFGGKEVERHIVILLVSVLATFFLLLEARRYRHYDIWQTRVSLLENDFFATLLAPDEPIPDQNWRELLASDLRHPKYHITFWEALGWRLRRNYAYIYAILLLTWLAKVSSHPDPVSSLDQLMIRAAFGPIPGWVMVLIGVVVNGMLVLIAILTAGLHSASGEIMTPHETRARINKVAPDFDEARLPFGEV